jgi:uncharacterized membrane protein
MKKMQLLDILALVAAIGSALIGGAFFAFSSFVMGALGKLAPPQGVAAMQSINLVVINPWFLGPFLGTALLCIGLAIAAAVNWREPGAAYLLAGALLYAVGTFLVTMVFNVPRNEALAAMTPDSAEAARLWADYLVSWTAWNHVRTVAAIAAVASFAMALRIRALAE